MIEKSKSSKSGTVEMGNIKSSSRRPLMGVEGDDNQGNQTMTMDIGDIRKYLEQYYASKGKRGQNLA